MGNAPTTAAGRKAGAYKMQFDEPYVRLKYAMKDSPAWRALSLSARRVLDRLEIELGRHRGVQRPIGS
jgi:hypothetical protein